MLVPTERHNEPHEKHRDHRTTIRDLIEASQPNVLIVLAQIGKEDE